MEQSPSWEASRPSASQTVPRIYGTRRFITAFTRARHLSLSWARSIQLMLRLYIRFGGFYDWFLTWLGLYGDKLLAPRPTPKLEGHPLSAILESLFSIFAATLHPQPEDAPCLADRNPLIAHCNRPYESDIKHRQVQNENKSGADVPNKNEIRLVSDI
jgi:hypothetical protein